MKRHMDIITKNQKRQHATKAYQVETPKPVEEHPTPPVTPLKPAPQDDKASPAVVGALSCLIVVMLGFVYYLYFVA